MDYRKVVAVLLLAFFIGACTVPEESFEESPTGTIAPATETITVTPTERLTATPRPTHTATPEPCVKLRSFMAEDEANRLIIVYVNNGDVWLWRGENCAAKQLTEYGDVDRVLLSDDGEVIVFGREIPLEPYDHDYELLAMSSDGTDERVLITPEGFLEIYMERDVNFEIREFQPNQMTWLPDSHVLVFNTTCCSPYPIGWKDMRFLDVDTGQLANILSADQGGTFHISPDGESIAISTTESISIYYTKTNTLAKNIFIYPQVITHSEFYYYAQPYWSMDSQSMTVAMPSIEPFDPGAMISIWEIDLTTNVSNQIGAFEGIYDLAISPDRKYLIFSTNNDIHLGELSNFEDSLYLSDARFGQNGDWNSSSQFFLYQPSRDRLIIGSQNIEPIELKKAAEYYFGIDWITEDAFYFAEDEGGNIWNIYLGEKNGTYFKLLESEYLSQFNWLSFDILLLAN